MAGTLYSRFDTARAHVLPFDGRPLWMPSNISEYCARNDGALPENAADTHVLPTSFHSGRT